MTSRTALMFALAIMLIVANVMGKGGQVSNIAAKDATQLRDNMEQIGDMDGFTPDDKIGLQFDEEERDEQRQQADAVSGKLAETDQPQIGEFSWSEENANGAPSGLNPARIARPAHHQLAPDDVRTDFNPTIRVN